MVHVPVPVVHVSVPVVHASTFVIQPENCSPVSNNNSIAINNSLRLVDSDGIIAPIVNHLVECNLASYLVELALVLVDVVLRDSTTTLVFLDLVG